MKDEKSKLNNYVMGRDSMKKENLKEEISYDPYEETANAIIIQACNDYKRAYRRSILNSEPSDSMENVELIELEEFFRSDWYKKLTTVDGEELMEWLRTDVLKKLKKI